MIRISLLPPELKKRQQTLMVRDNYVKIGVAVVAVFAAVFLLMLALTMNTNRELQTLKTQRQNLELQIAALREYEVMEATIKQLDALGKQAMGTLPNWSSILADVSMNLPAEIWLTDFTATQVGDVREITARGLSPTHQLVATWVESLKKWDKIENVRTQFSAETVIDNRVLYQFEVKAVAKPEPERSPLDRGGV
jgi:Tfp pilus assembly protein PilN